MRYAVAIAVVVASLAPLALVLDCATIAEPAGGDENLASTGVGPFRKLSGTEVRGTAPYVLDDATAKYRQPAALALSTDPSSTEVALYVVEVGPSGHDVIARTHALDGRTFYGATLDIGHSPKIVLSSDQPWEAPDLARPSALSVSGGVWMYYTSNGAVGRAISSDGLAFTKSAAPVLAADSLGPIASASVAALPDGTFRMMFAQGSAIYEASSSDGIAWQRVDADPTTTPMDPVLLPAPPEATLPPGVLPPFDTLSVGDPLLLPRITATGRLQLRVLYTGTALVEGGTASAIGFAARYANTGPLTRAQGAVYSVSKHERAPSLFAWSDGALLYVEEDSSSAAYRSIAGAFSPATDTLPAASDFPDAP